MLAVVFSEKCQSPNARTVNVERYCLPATTIHEISHVTFLALDFSIVSYMRLLFQLQSHGFSLMTKQQNIFAFMWN